MIRNVYKMAAGLLVFATNIANAAPPEVNASVEPGGAITINLLGGSTNQYDPSSLYIDIGPNYGWLVEPSNGRVVYNHYAGSGTTDRFYYLVSDYSGNYSSPTLVRVNVGGSPEPEQPEPEQPEPEQPGNNSIRVNVRGSCVDAPPLNDGWGWNGANSCTVTASNRTGTMLIAARGSCIDTVPLNDGYGWTGTSSCDLPPLGTPEEPEPEPPTNNGNWWQPKASDNLVWQLQLQGDIVLREGVDVYAVDSEISQASINAAKASGAKLMCYISGGSSEDWRADFNQFPAEVLGNNYDGWQGERWLDTRNIAALAPIMRARIRACKAKGFDALDVDNVNSYSNPTGFPISRQDSINYIRWLANEAHNQGMAFSLKNSEELVADLLGDIDMMQSEGCVIYSNCANASRLSAVNKPIFAVEYSDAMSSSGFYNRACNAAAQYNMSMIYRDRLLTPNGIYDSCN